VRLSNSYEAMFERAMDAVDVSNLGPAIEQFEYLTNRLLSLSPSVRERKPQLQQILTQSAVRWLTFLRWEGRNEDTLALLPRLREALPGWSSVWEMEEALNRIDSGEVNKGLDILRAVRMRSTESVYTATISLARELLGAALYDEAETLAEAALRAADDAHDELEAALLLMEIATERNDPDGIEAHWRTALSKLDAPPYFYPLLERLSALGHWERVEALVKEETNPWVRWLFQGKIARAKGDEAEALAQWQAILDSDEDAEDENGLYAFMCATLLLQQPEYVLGIVREDYEDKPKDTPLVIFVAAAAQMGKLDEAKEGLQHGLNYSRLTRPKRDRFPLHYWLRLQEFPLPDETREALRPFFVQPAE